MNADQTYFRTQITNIPVSQLQEIIQDEIIRLLFDFGQKVVESDQEFKYLVNETTATLRNYYPGWKLNYVDECFRRGKLDEFDRGQRVTVKRVQYWMKCYQIATQDKLKNQDYDKVYSQEDNDRFASNGRRFPNIMKYRQLRKPEYDGPEWTLAKIEETPEYKGWLRRGGAKMQVSESLIFTKI
ncbi:MAG: hypothetical protein WCJ95_09575 [Mariniphaga sp.]